MVDADEYGEEAEEPERRVAFELGMVNIQTVRLMVKSRRKILRGG